LIATGHNNVTSRNRNWCEPFDTSERLKGWKSGLVHAVP
jgi:hypothetical protein